ncbi:MAG: hypothetical protein Q7V57_19075 [Actinomycetota bacterium]|nr:hypothetical protein [Actinomycetota bacterium]
MTQRARFLAPTVLLLAMSGCGGGEATDKPTATFAGTIVFAEIIEVEGSSGSTMASAISLVDAQGTRQVASNGSIRDAYPAWSPDGTQIAYITIDYQLAVINRDGTGGATLTPMSSDQSLWPSHPEWLPDGNITVETDGALVVLAPDGTGVAALTPPGFTAVYTLSPDGTQVAYDCSSSISSEVCVFDLVTAESQTFVMPRPFYALSWSPDGTQLVAGGSTGAEDYPVAAADEDLFVFGADGSGVRALAQPGDEANPVWSPDGTKILYNAYIQSGDDTELGLWMINADGTGPSRLLNNAALQPDWTAR